MRITAAATADRDAWLALARDVDPLCGPMAGSPDFHVALDRAIACGTAFGARREDDPPDAPLLGGLLWIPDPPRYQIAWLAVTQQARRPYVARRLLDHALAQVVRPATVHLTTFAAGVPEGEAARRFYARAGFRPAGPAPTHSTGLPGEELSLAITRQSTARAVIVSGRRYLLAQHHYANPANHGKWLLIGGGIEDTERDPEAALRRELSEELSAPPVTVQPLHIYAHAERLHHVFTVELDRSRGRLRASPDEIAALGWFTFASVEALHRSDALFAPFVYDAIRDAHRARS